MKLLLDESVNTRLWRHFPGHDARTAEYMGWKGRLNGDLLALARDEFDVLITRDQRMTEEQNITARDVAIFVLYARSNGLDDLVPMVPQILERLPTVMRGEIIPIYPRQTED